MSDFDDDGRMTLIIMIGVKLGAVGLGSLVGLGSFVGLGSSCRSW